MIDWIRKRLRAEKERAFTDVVTGDPVYEWTDPKTGDTWLSTWRYSLFSVKTTRNDLSEVSWSDLEEQMEIQKDLIQEFLEENS